MITERYVTKTTAINLTCSCFSEVPFTTNCESHAVRDGAMAGSILTAIVVHAVQQKWVVTCVVPAAILAQQCCQFLCASEKLESLGILIAKNVRGGCRRSLGARLGQAAVICRRRACLTTLEGDLLAVTIILTCMF